ncbi:MAG TPA: hypothetical protein VER32_12660 [Pyrinomonadaceae bacterium]|nr:hypothetical protein [Pyrinomonadaceae bacterium]
MISLTKARTFAAVMTFLLLAPSAAPLGASARQGAADGTEVVIPDGTELTVVSTEEISSKTAVEGDPVTFKVDEDLLVNGKVVIARGAIVKGEISNAKKSGRMGKGGALSIRILSTTTVDDQKVKLRASKGREGDDKTGTTVALVVLFGPLGFLKKGKDAKIKEGTRIKAYTDEEKKVVVKSEQRAG